MREDANTLSWRGYATAYPKRRSDPFAHCHDAGLSPKRCQDSEARVCSFTTMPGTGVIGIIFIQ